MREPQRCQHQPDRYYGNICCHNTCCYSASWVRYITYSIALQPARFLFYKKVKFKISRLRLYRRCIEHRSHKAYSNPPSGPPIINTTSAGAVCAVLTTSSICDVQSPEERASQLSRRDSATKLITH